MRGQKVVAFFLLLGLLCPALPVGAQEPAQRTAPSQERPRSEPQSLPKPETRDRIINERRGVPATSDDRDKSFDPNRQRITSAFARQEEPEPPTEFQDFVYSSTGQKLDIFGTSLFREVPSTFAPVDHIPVTPDYTIGPGDEIILRGWGQVDIDYQAVVDRTGNIFIPKVGNINVAGVKYGQLQPYLKSAISRIFQNFELNVSLGELRSVQVFVMGQAKRPGSYTVSSLSTLVNALFASGGPSTRGSMRNIQLKRGNQVVVTFDLYKLLLNGDKSDDARLLSGDVIYIPPVGPSIAMVGSVNVPAIYEINQNSLLGDAIGFAGGLTPTAAGKSATIEHISSRTVRTVEEVLLDESGLRFPVKDGDLITVRPLAARFDNAVTLRGNVTIPGRYAWKQGMRVHDVIPTPESLVTRKFWLSQERLGQAVLRDRFEEEEEEEPKRDNDRPKFTQERAKTRNGNVEEFKQQNGPADSISESRREEAEAAKDKRALAEQKLRNQVKRGAPEVNWEYAVVQRFNREDLTTRLIPFNLGNAIRSRNSADDLELMPGDIITIFSQADIEVPKAKQSKFVRLEGEFKVAGVYEAKPGETLHQLIERIGGITPDAYVYGAEFTRESARQDQQKRLDEFVDRLEQDVERLASAKGQNVVSAEEAAGLRSKVESQRKLVEKIRSLKASGRIILGVGSDAAERSALPDLVLEDGDRLMIPARPATVNVIGAVYRESSYLFKSNRSVGYYLAQAGGGTKLSDKGHSFLLRANGAIVGKSRTSGWFSSSFENVKPMPGDTIVIPEQLDKESLLKTLKDWSLVFGQLALGAAALRTLTSQ
jgi:polysaccharide biosynthesis/export protein